jgi:hypothetical protein
LEAFLPGKLAAAEEASVNENSTVANRAGIFEASKTSGYEV